jgi:hypothetical protein
MSLLASDLLQQQRYASYPHSWDRHAGPIARPPDDVQAAAEVSQSRVRAIVLLGMDFAVLRLLCAILHNDILS